MNFSVLIIDDDPEIRDALAIALQRKGFKASSDDHLTLNELNDFPDIILLDVAIGDRQGTAICKEIKSNSATENIPVLMMSANSSNCTSCLAVKADGFIEKPFKLSELIDRINYLLGVYG